MRIIIEITRLYKRHVIDDARLRDVTIETIRLCWSLSGRFDRSILHLVTYVYTRTSRFLDYRCKSIMCGKGG